MEETNNNAQRQGRSKLIALKSTQIFLVAAIILLTLVITVMCIGFLVRYEVESDVWNVDSVHYWVENLAPEQKKWYDDGINELRAALKVSWQKQEARNVVLFVTHGISETALAAARFSLAGKGAQQLNWETFPHLGRILNSCNGDNSCDAYTATTALFTGVQTSVGVGGLDSAVELQNCTQTMQETHQLKSIFQMAQQIGLRTGFVTTRRVTGSTVAALYAHTPDTRWECDAAMPPEKILQGCKDVATQLIDDSIGTSLNVIMGGGRQTLVSSTPVSVWDPLDTNACKSQDARNYLREWRTNKLAKQQHYALLRNAPELKNLNGSNVDYVLGIFANGDIKPPWQWNSTENHMPELDDMVTKALGVLKRKENGFLFMVESGNVVKNDLAEEIMELKRLNATVTRALNSVGDDTLIIVLFTNGFLASKSFEDSQAISDEEILQSSVNDFQIFAKGPSAYLFHGVYEETYLAHAIAYALKMGQFHRPL